MKNEQVLSIVDDFIEKRVYHYALMINGSWGSGKTYFVSNYLIPHIREYNKRDINYLSLYGIKDPDEIADKLCGRAIRDKITSLTGKNKEGKGAQIADLVITNMLKYGAKKIDLDTNDFNSLAAILPNYDNNVIIFDDLERCNCDVCAVLGYINEFIEHSDASVIIIANEDEIGKRSPEESQELQMLVALHQRLKVELPTKNLEELYEQTSDKPKDHLTPGEVHSARKMIFKYGEQYRRTKEKVIGVTINYVPDLEQVFTQLISEKVTDVPLRDILLNAVPEYVNMAERENHRNIRSFLFFIEKMKQIYSVTTENVYPVIHQVAIYCFRSIISRMKGEEAPVWNEEQFGTQSFGDALDTEDNPFGFRFVDELINSDSIDGKTVCETLSSYYSIKIAEGSLDNDPYQKLLTWYRLTDTELKQVLLEINCNIQNEKYSALIFPQIIPKLASCLRYNLYTEICCQIIESMKAFICKARGDKMTSFPELRTDLDREALKQYHAILAQLRPYIEEVSNQIEEEYWNTCIREEKWSESLLSGVYSHEGNRSFIYWLQPQMLFDLIKRSKNDDIDMFRKALSETYWRGEKYKHYYSDLQHLMELSKLLDSTDGMGKIQVINCGWIQEDLKEIIERIRSDTHNEN